MPSHSEPQIAALRSLISLFAILLISVTWPLWNPWHLGIQIPWVSFLQHTPQAIDWSATIVLFVGATGCLLTLGRGNHGKGLAGLFAAALFVVLSLDQHRLQPWAWQFLIMMTLLSLATGAVSIRCCRWLVISIYFYSAVSKVDLAFLQSQGDWLLQGLLAPLGVSTQYWSASQKQMLAAIFPAGEFLIAGLLAWKKTRYWGLRASLLMHLLLLWTLGRGLGHGWSVLLWNVYFILQNLILFSDVAVRSSQWWPFKAGQEARSQRKQVLSSETADRLGITLTVIVILAPMQENWGMFDHWPSWAVYSSRSGQVQVVIDEDIAERLPEPVKKFLRPPAPLQSGITLNLEAWSFETRGCPIYPQTRYRLALAKAMLQEHVPDQSVSVQIRRTPERFTGLREQTRLFGLQGVERYCQRFWCNTEKRFPTITEQRIEDSKEEPTVITRL